ncbi:MAG: sugar ABC transporter permease [Lachnospiraceae bacterium]|jgi:putative aldouronate transport system permease protein|nr:sugar ABC transporter permease [Lachnospiraceae bacterium]MCI8994725.1 sugar ABC transporter permease [Lachnospiraceae bacterium]
MSKFVLGEKNKKLRLKIRRHKWVYLMLAPAIICSLLFSYIPLSAWYVAFSEYHLGGSLFGGEFVGLKYFYKIFQDSSDLGYLVQNTLVINGVSLAVVLVAAMALAILLQECRWKKGAKLVQTVSFFPYFISWVVAYALVWALLAVKSGSINQFLVNAGILKQGINVLGEAKYSWRLMILLNVWKSIGYNTVIFLSTIAGIPSDQYEAARIDGAGRFQLIRYVTLPNLLPTLSVLLVMNAGWILNSNLEQFFIFYNATNWSRMEVLDMYIYKFGLKMLDFPYATAMSVIKSFVSILLLVAVNKVVKRINKQSMF